MKAFVMREPGDVAIETVADAVAANDDVLLKVRMICLLYTSEIGVRCGVRRADESDRLWHSFLEDQVRFVNSGHACQRRRKRSLGRRRAYGEKLFGHEDLRQDEVFPQSLQDVKDPGYVVDQ